MEMKENILVKSAELISRRGIENFSLKSLSDSLGINKASLYYYYRSKEEIISAMHDYFHKRLNKRSYKIELQENAEDNLIKLIGHWQEIFLSDEFYDYLRVLLSLRQNDDRSYECWHSISLTILGQSEIILEKITKKAELAAPLFACLLELNLEKTLLDENDDSLEDLASSFISFLH